MAHDQIKPTGPAHGDKKAKKTKTDVPVWLQVVAGVIAILAFLGIADYRQLATALGWRKADTTASPPSPSPSPSPVPSETGPVDPQDAGTCRSALSAIHSLQSYVPTYSNAATIQFYSDESLTFSNLQRGAIVGAFQVDLGDIGVAMVALYDDYRFKALNDPAYDHSESDLSALSGYESKTELFCANYAGVTG